MTSFFEAGKIFWSVVAPESLLVITLLAGFIALLRGRRRAATNLIGAVTALLVTIGFFPLGNLLMVPLESRFPANPPLTNVAGIVVLGGGGNIEVATRWHQPALNEAGDRFLAGADLARRFPKARLYFTGGNGRLLGGASEASMARRIFMMAGVAPKRIVLEGQSRSTAENARLLRQKIPAGASGQWVLVTSAFHMPRAMASFCAAGWKGLIAYPTDYQTSSFAADTTWTLASHLARINLGAKEWIGLLAYEWTGRASASC